MLWRLSFVDLGPRMEFAAHGEGHNILLCGEGELKRDCDTWIKHRREERKMTEICLTCAVFLAEAELGICSPELSLGIRHVISIKTQGGIRQLATQVAEKHCFCTTA